MSRSLPAECNTPEWNRQMHDFTVNAAVAQARSVIRDYRNKHGYALWDKPVSEFDILHWRYEWHEDFIMAVLTEKQRQDNLNAEQAFLP